MSDLTAQEQAAIELAQEVLAQNSGQREEHELSHVLSRALLSLHGRLEEAREVAGMDKLHLFYELKNAEAKQINAETAACRSCRTELTEARRLLDVARFCLGQIIGSLPANRDWLDPAIERESRVAAFTPTEKPK